MFFIDLMFALVLALVLSFFVPGAFGWRRPGCELLWDNMVFIFIIVFLITWAGGAWLPRFGPVWRGGHWLPFLLTAMFVVVLLLAVVPPQGHRARPRALEGVRPEMAAKRSPGAFFWILVVSMGIAIIIHYLGQLPGLRAVFYDNSN